MNQLVTNKVETEILFDISSRQSEGRMTKEYKGDMVALPAPYEACVHHLLFGTGLYR